MPHIAIIMFFLVMFLPAGAFGSIVGLELHGKGEFRYLGFIKVYDAALYLQNPAATDEILDAGTSRCLKLDYTVPLRADDFKMGAFKILSRQHTPEKLASVNFEIERLHNAYRDVREGDSYSLCYDASRQTTTLVLNQQELVTIASPDFAEIYFGIWLSPENPMDEDLRNQLLKPATSEK